MNQKNSKVPASFRVSEGLPSSMKKTGIAVGLSSAMLVPAMAHAQTAGEEVEMKPVTVVERVFDHNPYAEPDAPYKARISGDARHTRQLAETPSNISVLTKTQIEDSGYTDLRDILDSQPGITLGTGENGNAFGDRYIIRGQEARSDVFVDGLRDPGMSTRESFAVEQIYISKGPNSSFAGRGTAGGAVNAITKQATLDHDFTRFSAGVGSDSQRRITSDVNRGYGENFAVRANILWGEEAVPGRSPSSRSRSGLALSGLWEATDNFSLTTDYYGLRTKDNMPDLGGYLVGTVPNRVPATNVPVYAQSSDFLKSDVDTLTARINWKIAPDLKLTSLTRYGKSSNAYVTTGANNATRYNGQTGVAYTTAALDNGHTGWQDIDYFAHQSNLRWDKQLAGLKHEFIFGAEYTDHKVVSGTYQITNAGAFNCKTTAGI